MAAIQPKPLRLIKTASGQAPEFDLITVVSTVPTGDLCVKANGAADSCGSDPAQISYLATCEGDDLVPGQTRGMLQRIRASDTYRANIYSATPSLAVLADSALDAQTSYGVVWATVSGVAAWFVDVDDAVFIKARVVARTDSATDTYPEVYIQFLQSVLTYA